MEITHEFEASGLITIEGYTPERSVPDCSNPDSPMFSDDGDPADYERCDAVIIVGNREIELTEDQAIAIYEALEHEISETAEDVIYNSL